MHSPLTPNGKQIEGLIPLPGYPPPRVPAILVLVLKVTASWKLWPLLGPPPPSRTTGSSFQNTSRMFAVGVVSAATGVLRFFKLSRPWGRDTFFVVPFPTDPVLLADMVTHRSAMLLIRISALSASCKKKSGNADL